MYLLDEVIGIGSHQRVTLGAAAAILEETLESSYRKGGEHASLTDQVRRQSVKDLVHSTIIEMPMEKKEKSRSKRYRLTGKHYFCGLYAGKENEKLWEEVRDYIYENYEWEHLEKIYIAGDGAAWGCHAEGQVNHVLSSRMSSRPMGWSRRGADQMARLRTYRMNGGKIIDLLKYQKKKQKKEERLEKKEELVRELRRSQAGRKYARSLQCHVPGIEAHSMKWMREMLEGQLCS